MSFDTAITFTGPPRSPRQMLAEQSYDGHASVHDDATADALGLAGAPIEGPTHFSVFDPLAFQRWGQAWFERGCISAHFKNMVVEGEDVVADLVTASPTSATIHARKGDGTAVLEGTATIGDADETELDRRLAGMRDPGRLHIVDRLAVGQRSEATTTSMDLDRDNGALYPFSLRAKLDAITERTRWYDNSDNPWGRPIVPFEMISVLIVNGY